MTICQQFRFLTDTNSQVRKTSQAALLVLLEQGLVDTNDAVEQVRESLRFC